MVVLSSPTLYISARRQCFGIVLIYSVQSSSIILKSVLSTTLVHQFGAAGYKFRRRRPKHISERGNEEI